MNMETLLAICAGLGLSDNVFVLGGRVVVRRLLVLAGLGRRVEAVEVDVREMLVRNVAGRFH